MTLVCGVDCSTLERPNWIAWLEDDHFTLDVYIPSRERPLPLLTVRPGRVQSIAFDAPQGLPAQGAKAREADIEANAPTRRLPNDRVELKTWRAYRGLIEVGVSVFWWAYSQRLASVVGLPTAGGNAVTIMETYPRYVIKRLWPNLKIPSKKNSPLQYIDAVYARIQKMGYTCRSVIRPSVDQVDAMLCSLAARAFTVSRDLPGGTVGRAPTVDEEASVLREGFIVSA